MTDDRVNLRTRREILAGYIAVLDRPGKLIELCSVASDDPTELQLAVARVFDFSPVVAEAVLSMQVRRLTSGERRRILDELAGIDAELGQ
ncbi:hypothetical protein ACIGEP_16570 [Microbacterium sp. NPDC077663]|uniref:hypothetical protein n=1 Tax=Microbacterium sp. NPDC077663 TaxID=3364189 RepID=UPI0037CB93EF